MHCISSQSAGLEMISTSVRKIKHRQHKECNCGKYVTVAVGFPLEICFNDMFHQYALQRFKLLFATVFKVKIHPSLKTNFILAESFLSCVREG